MDRLGNDRKERPAESEEKRREKNARTDEIRRKYGLTSSKDLEEEGYKYKRMS